MSMNQHGPFCDVCNAYILFDESLNPFTIFGVEGLHSHDKCKPLLLALDHSRPRFWDALPDGPVKELANRLNEEGKE